MSYVRISATSWIVGLVLVGNTGLGVLGSAIPSSGTDGSSFLYNDITLPADANKQIRALILTRPSAGTLFVYEHGGFIFFGAPDGTYTFTYQVYADGVTTGSPATVTLNVGSGVSASINSVSVCTGSLTTGIRLSTTINSVSISTASLLTAIKLAASPSSVATAHANLTAGDIFIPPAVRTVIFDGGTNLADFGGATNSVIFNF